MMHRCMGLWDQDASLYEAVGQWCIAVWGCGTMVHRCMGLCDHDASLYGAVGP